MLREVVADGSVEEVARRASIIVEVAILLVVGIDAVGEIVDVPQGYAEATDGVACVDVGLLVVAVHLHATPCAEAEVVVVVGDGKLVVEGQTLGNLESAPQV